MKPNDFARRDFLKMAAGSALVQPSKLMEPEAPAGTFTLVEDGAASNAIFMAEGAPPPVVLAAGELQHYVERMSGARLSVKTARQGLNLLRIGAAESVVPNVEAPQGEDDSFCITTTPQGIAMIGANPRSTLYAAYEVLERLGCRWFYPGEDGEHVPPARTLTLTVGESLSRAAFATRGMVEDARPGSGYPPYPPDAAWEKRIAEDAEIYIIWAVRNRMNAYRNTSTLDNAEFDRRGVAVRWGSSHTIPQMLDRKLFETKPELFRMNQTGKRVPDGNVCVTNPETVALCARWVTNFFKQNPMLDTCPMGGQDIWGGAWCNCEKCRAYSPSEQAAVLINGVHEHLRKNNVKGRCSYSAYRDTLRYDLKKVKLDPEVHIGYAPRERSYGHAHSDVSSERNRWFWSNLQDWRRNHSGPLNLTDYYQDSILFYSLPAPTVQVIAQDLRDYSKLNARGITSFMMGRYSWYCYGPSLYVYARMAWDPALDPDTLLDEIAQFHYGPAAASIRSFWRELESGMQPFLARGEFETLPVTPDPFLEAMMADFDQGIARLERAESHIRQALTCAPAPPYAARVRLQEGIYQLARTGAEALRHNLHGNYWAGVAQRDDAQNAASLRSPCSQAALEAGVACGTNVRGVANALERLKASRTLWDNLKEIAGKIDPEPGSYWVRGPRGGGIERLRERITAQLNYTIRAMEDIARRSTL
jgi:hypothetical protein